MPAVPIISAAAGAYSAISSANAAKKAAKSQAGAQAADLAFRKEMYQKWVNDYETPLVKPLIKDATSERPLNLGPAWSNIQSNFDASGRNLEAAYAKSGMTGSGLDRSSKATLELGRNAALGDAFQRGLLARDARRLQLAQFGKSSPDSVGALQQGYQNTANMYGNRAAQYGAAASDAWGGVGSALGTLGQIWGRSTVGSATPALESQQMSQPGTQTLAQVRALENPGYGQAMVAPAATLADAPSYMLAPRAQAPVAIKSAWDFSTPNTYDY